MWTDDMSHAVHVLVFTSKRCALNVNYILLGSQSKRPMSKPTPSENVQVVSGTRYEQQPA